MQLHGADVTYGAFEWSKQTSQHTSSASSRRADVGAALRDAKRCLRTAATKSGSVAATHTYLA
jgi:hypothetical protein